MANLTVKGAIELGPLSVEIFPSEGWNLHRKPVVLSSAQPLAVIPNLPTGSYAIVATRPNGEVLSNHVTLVEDDNQVHFGPMNIPAGNSLREELQRGLLPQALVRNSQGPHSDGHLLRHDQRRLIGAASFGTKLSDVASTLIRRLVAPVFKQSPVVVHWIGLDGKRTEFSLQTWQLDQGRWDGSAITMHHDQGADYLKLHFKNPKTAAVALQDKNEHGPIFTIPALKDGLTLTLLAAGLPRNGPRDDIPPPTIPLAVAVPQDPILADLLSGLTAPAFPGAQDLSEYAAEVLVLRKQDPAAAILAAHYLLRFAPSSIAVDWLHDLNDDWPEFADSAVLLAWHYIVDGPGKEADARQSTIALLKEADQRPCTLFERTRQLLNQGLRMYCPENRSNEYDGGRVGFQNVHFLNASLSAGGLDAFWGSHPSTPSLPLARVVGQPAVEF